MYYYIWCCIGIVIGSIISNIIFYYKVGVGTLRIDYTNPKKDVYRIEMGDLDKLKKKKRLILKIDHDANLSQK